MAIKYFLKELVNNPVLDSKGKRIQFEAFGGETGLLALDDTNPDQKPLADELTKMIGTLGILSIGQAEYERVKKKTDWKTFAPQSEMLRPVKPFNPVQANPDTGSIQFQRPPGHQHTNVADGSRMAAVPAAPVTQLPPAVANGETPPPAASFKPRVGRARAAKAATPSPA
jgi:hypothetical protein